MRVCEDFLDDMNIKRKVSLPIDDDDNGLVDPRTGKFDFYISIVCCRLRGAKKAVNEDFERLKRLVMNVLENAVCVSRYSRLSLYTSDAKYQDLDCFEKIALNYNKPGVTCLDFAIDLDFKSVSELIRLFNAFESCFETMPLDAEQCVKVYNQEFLRLSTQIDMYSLRLVARKSKFDILTNGIQKLSDAIRFFAFFRKDGLLLRDYQTICKRCHLDFSAEAMVNVVQQMKTDDTYRRVYSHGYGRHEQINVNVVEAEKMAKEDIVDICTIMLYDVEDMTPGNYFSQNLEYINDDMKNIFSHVLRPDVSSKMMEIFVSCNVGNPFVCLVAYLGLESFPDTRNRVFETCLVLCSCELESDDDIHDFCEVVSYIIPDFDKEETSRKIRRTLIEFSSGNYHRIKQ